MSVLIGIVLIAAFATVGLIARDVVDFVGKNQVAAAVKSEAELNIAAPAWLGAAMGPRRPVMADYPMPEVEQPVTGGPARRITIDVITLRRVVARHVVAMGPQPALWGMATYSHPEALIHAIVADIIRQTESHREAGDPGTTPSV